MEKPAALNPRRSELQQQWSEALDAALNCRTVNLRLVKFLVNLMKSKKGRHKENLVWRLGSVNLCHHPKYLVENEDVICYLVKCSKEYEKFDRWRRSHKPSTRTVLLDLMSHERENPKLVGECVSRILHKNDIDPIKFFQDSDFLSHIMITSKLAEIAMAMGWLSKSWSTLWSFLRQGSTSLSSLFEWILHLDPLTLTPDLAIEILLATIGGHSPELCDFMCKVFMEILPHSKFDFVVSQVTDCVFASKYHSPAITHFMVQHSCKTMTDETAASLLCKASGKIASELFYRFTNGNPRLYQFILRPPNLGYLLYQGSTPLLYTLVWESNANLTQLLATLSIHQNRHSIYVGIRPQQQCVLEMYNFRVAFKNNRRIKLRYLLPDRVSKLILALGWIGGDFP